MPGWERHPIQLPKSLDFKVDVVAGGYQLTPYDPGFEKKMEKADDIIGRYRNTLHVLAK